MQRFMPILVGLLIVLAALSSCVFVVRERDYALVFSLGEVRKTISEPGLYFKAPPPFQNVVTLDKRVLTIETNDCLLYTSPSPRDLSTSRMPSSA